jgi:hypothetical protein
MVIPIITITLNPVSQFCAVYHNPAPCITILRRVSQICAVYHNSAPCVTILHRVSQFCTVYHNSTQCITILHRVSQTTLPVRCTVSVLPTHVFFVSGKSDSSETLVIKPTARRQRAPITGLNLTKNHCKT